MLRKIALCSCLAVFAITAGTQARASSVTVFDVPGSNMTTPHGINASGVIVGEFAATVSNSSQGFVRTATGRIQTLHLRNVTWTSLVGINDRGDVIGGFGRRGTEFAFVRPSGESIRVIHPRGAVSTTVVAINDAGVSVGNFNDASGRTHGFVRSASGDVRGFVVPGADATYPVAINRRGWIAGNYEAPGLAFHPFLRSPSGHFFFLANDGGADATGITSNATVVGYVYGTDGHWHGFSWARNGDVGPIDTFSGDETFVGGTMPSGVVWGSYDDENLEVDHGFTEANGVLTTIDPVGSVETEPSAISRNGALTGSFSDGSRWHGFVASP